MLIKELKRSHLLELAKFSGLFFYTIVYVFVWAINPSDDRLAKAALSSNGLSFLTGYISISLLFLLLNYQTKKKILFKRNAIYLTILSCYLSATLWIVLMNNFSRLLRSEEFFFTSYFFIKSFNYFFLVIAFAGLYYLINHWLNLKKQREMTLQATNLANEAQLQMLRYQINPHFLFNALNTIRSMVEEDKTVARNMITELSNFFRYSLSQNGTTDTFENEINAIKNYLEIQKIRFEEKLVIEYDIDERLYQMKIPFFIILPLVENAIKFGLQSSKTPLNIKIIAKANSHLEISVHNTGHLVECDKSSEGTKTGIENTKKRLSLYFPNNYSFKLVEKDSWVISQIIINDYKNQLAE